ncbi:MAG TPA: HpcH/HpaI aldolase/citrate lyase family protein [Longimicrobium sp.]|nr:HpcH/HpaI aldolase/citrate lyase family protein [Longimicrobium sp.]
MKHLHLGASLYVPATRDDLVALGNGRKYPRLRSLIFCTEDGIRPEEVELALLRLGEALPWLEPTPMLRFVRVRDPRVMERVLALRGIGAVDGFVLPKATRRSMRDYLSLLGPSDHFLLMPTLETAEAFDPREMAAFRDLVSDDAVRPRVLALRIGGNDLLHLLGVRRSPRRTIYETALGPVLSILATTFLPHGFALTAPVFEGLAHPDVLQAEVARDVEHGFLGKTAVHPDQVALIEAMYAVERHEMEMAQAMLAPGVPAVFRMHGVMCEEATHRRWAHTICARAEIFGVTDEVEIPPAGLLAAAAPPRSMASVQ